MVLIGLLLAALACIVLGVIFASGPWFVGSLVASLLAGYVLFRKRDEIGGRPGGTDAPSGSSSGSGAVPSRQTALVTGTAFAGKTTDPAPAEATAAPAGATAAPAGATAAPADGPSALPGTVWVVDGRPEFHLETCTHVKGQHAEAVPYAQAVEDGFTECPACRPATAAPVPSVWVVDGRPEYHQSNCEHLAGADGEEIPQAQAVEDGFIACPACRPDADAATAPAAAEPDVAPQPDAAPPPDDGANGAADQTAGSRGATALPSADAAATTTVRPAVDGEEKPRARPGEVWVVDGRPRYHLETCMIIEGEIAEPIPLDQATEDGFIACSMCEPNATRV